MGSSRQSIAVITADVIASRRYSDADRRRLDRIVRAAFVDMNRRFPGTIQTMAAFRVTAGDEFQCVFGDLSRATRALTYLRAVAATGGLSPPIRFRASLGLGERSTAKRPNPYQEDGSAFARSRQGLETLAATRSPVRWTKFVTGREAVDDASDAVLSLADHLFQSWTVSQWEAVRWTLLGETRQEIAGRLEIAHQNVSKRLRAAGWSSLEPALDFLDRLLEGAGRTSNEVR
ncbi:MAG TPA: SatD family protein [Candidatus Eisenbacteria bacterium]|nr:SatD family protein [Candidatus Eisenbacteria bacterium]